MALVHTIHQGGLQLSDRDGSRSIYIYIGKPLPKLWISPSRWTMLLVSAMSTPSIALRGRSVVRLVPRLIVVVHGTNNGLSWLTSSISLSFM
jgi:hypothetical protein